MTFVPSDEQRAVIEAPLGSMRISAGAGTGKTTTIAHRVAELIRSGAAEPEGVLGITFTNKAAEELADRIRSVLGVDADPIRQIDVHTYHGFAAALLHEFGSLVGVERDAGIVTPTFSRQIVADILRHLDLDHYDISGFRATEEVLRLGSSLADHLHLPSEVVAPASPDEVWLQRSDMLEVLRAYQAEKQRLGVVDYGDLILTAARLLDQHPSVVDSLRARYSVVLLDEYQDTNPAQREMLRGAFAHVTPVLAVGDPDQTIYEWRGASLENFAAFPEHFALGDGPAPTLPLLLNRRSSTEIVEVANRVRERIDPVARRPLQPLPTAGEGIVRVGRFGTAVDEADWIARDIIRHHEDGTGWAEQAVLFRKNRSMLAVQEALSRNGVPFEVANLGGLLSIPEVADLHAWLRLVDRPEDGTALARIALGARYRLGLADLARPAAWVRVNRRLDDTDLDHEQIPDYTLLEALDHLDDLDLRPAARAALGRLAEEHRHLLRLAQGLTLVELCRSILDVTGAWSDLEAMDPVAGLSARLNLYRFLDLAESWSPLEGRPSLSAFLDHLDALADDTAEELDVARVSDADAVLLITVHRAKGLEWPVVYLPALAHNTFPSRATRFEDPYAAPQFVPHELRLDRATLPPVTPDMPSRSRADLFRASHLAQEWRIAYVAVTRAKRELVATSAHWYGHPSPTRRPSPPGELYELLAEGRSPVVDTPEPPPRPDTLGYRRDDLPAPDPLFDDGWAAALRTAIRDPEWCEDTAETRGVRQAYAAQVAAYQRMLFELPEPLPTAEERRVETSVTGLVTYASCPRRFFWSEVDRLPRRPSEAARRGVDVHRRIELHHRGVVPLEDVDEDTYDRAPDETGDETTDGSTERSERGGDPYRVFLESRFAETTPAMVEAPFELRLPNDAWIRGRIDAVFAGERWEVVDFKSGRAKTAPHLDVQLQAYVVALLDTGVLPDPIPPISATFAYLGGGTLEERSQSVDDAWVAAARTELVRLTDGIDAEDFDPTPGPDCRNCDFLRFCPEGRRALEAS